MARICPAEGCDQLAEKLSPYCYMHNHVAGLHRWWRKEKQKDAAIRVLGDMQRLQPQPGDVFVLTVEAHLNEEEAMGVRAKWQQAMGDVQLLVLGPGMRLGCVAAPTEA